MMLKPQGYATITDPEAGLTELDTFTCNHCNTVHHVQPRERPEDTGGMCMICMKLICKHCVGQPCDPFMEKLNRMEARYHALRSYG